MHGSHGAFMSYAVYNTGRRNYDIAKLSARSVSVVHLYGEHLKGVKTNNPCSEEQNKIGKSYWHCLDERISNPKQNH